MKQGQIVGAVLIAGGIAIGTYFSFFHKFKDGLSGWQKIFKKKDSKAAGLTSGGATPPATTPPSGALPSGFPLEFNKKNSNVRNLQMALQNKWGKLIAGAPSDLLGANTLRALNEIGYSTPISKADYDNIIAGNKKPTVMPKVGDLAKATRDNVIVYNEAMAQVATARGGDTLGIVHEINPSVGRAKLRHQGSWRIVYLNEMQKA